ncbi:MAG: T9SS type A sorting domain-containing protein [Bacteroidetes bacterium]|nr:T9SS type A sorting domain-containing protein [Bacteroidota bacterium]
MKKSLLIALAVTLAVSVTAQRRMLNPSNRLTLPNKMSLVKEPVQSHSSILPKTFLNQRRGVLGTNHTQSTIQLGDAASALGCFGIAHSNLWYDPDLNSIAFIHRNNPAIYGNNTSFILYDYSTDGGNTWSSNQGPVYGDSTNLHRGRYPSGLLANPGLGTTATDGYVAAEGPAINATTWFGRYYGVSNLGGASHAFHYDSLAYICWPDNMFTVKYTGDIWKVGKMYSNDGNTTFLDTIVITHGVWNSTNSDYDFTEYHRYMPTNPDLGEPVDLDIAFDDFGSTGYIAMSTNNDPIYDIYADSTLYLSVLKTTDGGINWNWANACPGRPDIIDVYKLVNPVLANDPSGTASYGLNFDQDVVVDAGGNLHVLTGICLSQGFSVYTGDSLWGMFDIYTTDQGSTWKVQKLDRPVTSRGTFGDPNVASNPTNNQDGRPFAARNADGSKLFFCWFDTDTVQYGTQADGHNNKSPDLHAIAYDVNTNLWTDTMNLTRNDADASGLCTYGNGSYYVIDSASTGTTFSIPVVFQQLQDALSTGLPTTFWYVKNANVHFPATNTLTPLTVGCVTNGVQTVANTNAFSVSANYPNPFSGATSIDVNLEKASDVSVEVSNLLGQVISMTKYSNLNSGMHTLTIDAHKLSSGIYMYKVKAGNEVVTRKMTIE